MMNDFCLDLIMIKLKRTEIPFETYKDLHDSKLEFYTNQRVILTHTRSLTVQDEDWYFPIIKRTKHYKNMKICFKVLRDRKIVSCIVRNRVADHYISQFPNPDGPPAMKIAQPPMNETTVPSYWFVQGSPYAIKFSEMLHLIEESKLYHWEALTEKEPDVMELGETNRMTIEKKSIKVGIKMVLSLYYFLAYPYPALYSSLS